MQAVVVNMMQRAGSCDWQNRNNKQGFLFSAILKPLHFILLRPLKLSTLSRNVIASSRKSKTVGGGLNTVPYNDRNFFSHFVFQEPNTNLDRFTKEITRERTKILSLALRLYRLL